MRSLVFSLLVAPMLAGCALLVPGRGRLSPRRIRRWSRRARRGGPSCRRRPRRPPALTKEELEAAKIRQVREETVTRYAQVTSGYTRIKEEEGDLATPNEHKTKLALGSCYRIIIKLEDERGISGPLADASAEWGNLQTGTGISLQTLPSSTLFASDAMCPTTAGSVKVRWKKRDLAKPQPDGAYHLEVWSKALTAEEQKKTIDDERGKWEVLTTSWCNTCRDRARQCHDASSSACQAEFRSCLAKHATSVSDCTR